MQSEIKNQTFKVFAFVRQRSATATSSSTLIGLCITLFSSGVTEVVRWLWKYPLNIGCPFSNCRILFLVFSQSLESLNKRIWRVYDIYTNCLATFVELVLPIWRVYDIYTNCLATFVELVLPIKKPMQMQKTLLKSSKLCLSL